MKRRLVTIKSLLVIGTAVLFAGCMTISKEAPAAAASKMASEHGPETGTFDDNRDTPPTP